METNAPQTPSSPDGSSIQDNPVQPNPVQPNPVQPNPVQPNPVQPNPVQPNPVQPNPVQPNLVTERVSMPARRKGPNVSAIILGLVAVLLAGLIIANETAGLQVDWSRLGPGVIVGIGLLLVILGATGLVRRHDDA